MQGRGVPPTAVENAIDTGTRSAGNTSGTSVYTDPANGVTVVTNSNGRVITVITSKRPQ
jgi:CubicO group peptidase (beta-lactamase class C family)